MVDKTSDELKAMSDADYLKALKTEEIDTTKKRETEKAKADFMVQRDAALKTFDAETQKQIGDLNLSRSAQRTALEKTWTWTEA